MAFDWELVATPPSGEPWSWRGITMTVGLAVMEALSELSRLAQGAAGVMGCNHARAAMAEGKCYCPDCGRGIVYQWVNLRCGGCQIRRDSAYRLGRIVAADPFCRQCGASAVYAEYLENARPHQLHKAKLVMLVDTEYEHQYAPWAERIRAWTQSAVPVAGLLTA